MRRTTLATRPRRRRDGGDVCVYTVARDLRQGRRVDAVWYVRPAVRRGRSTQSARTRERRVVPWSTGTGAGVGHRQVQRHARILRDDRQAV